MASRSSDTNIKTLWQSSKQVIDKDCNFVANALVVENSAVISGDLYTDGTLYGNVVAETLTVETFSAENSVISGDLYVDGTIYGNVDYYPSIADTGSLVTVRSPVKITNATGTLDIVPNNTYISLRNATGSIRFSGINSPNSSTNPYFEVGNGATQGSDVHMSIFNSGNIRIGGPITDPVTCRLNITGPIGLSSGSFSTVADLYLGIHVANIDARARITNQSAGTVAYAGFRAENDSTEAIILKIGSTLNTTNPHGGLLRHTGSGPLNICSDTSAVVISGNENPSTEPFAIFGPSGAVTLVGIVEYADNAAAVTAGLTVGRVYRTGGALKFVTA